MPIEITPDDATATLSITVTGRLHRDDYARLVPAFEAFADKHDRVSILFVMRDFHGWDLGSAWDDFRMWTHHIGDFRRFALVGDHGWQHAMSALCRVVTMAPLKYFDMSQLDEAKQWVTGPDQGHMQLDLDEDNAIARVKIDGALSPEDFERITPQIDAFIEKHEAIRIRLDLRDFVGWDSIESLVDHFSFVRKHQRFAGRLAVIGSKRWQRVAAKLIGHAVHPEVRVFASSHEKDADQWLRDG